MSRSVSAARLLFGALVIGALACDDAPTDPGGNGEPGLHVLAGAGQSDTIQAQLDQALVVAVRDSTGALAPGSAVRFDVADGSSGLRVRALTDVEWVTSTAIHADGRGRALVEVRLGTITGEQAIVVRAPEFGFTATVTVQIRAGAVVGTAIAPRDTARVPGGSFVIRGRALDRLENVVHEGPLGEAAGYAVLSGAATVSADGLVTAGGEFGRASIEVEHGTGVDTVWLSVVPAGVIVGVRHDGPTAPDLVRFATDGEDWDVLAEGASEWIELNPTASPVDGRIVFQTGHPDTRLVERTSALNVAITPSPTPAHQIWPQFTADGGTIVFSGGPFDGQATSVWAAPADGGAAVEVRPTDDEVVAPSRSPAGTRLAYVLRSSSTLEIYDVGLDSVVASIAGVTMAKWSPTGDRIALVSEGRLYVVNGDGAEQQLVAEAEPAGYTVRNLAWAPDGEWVIVHAPEFPSAWNGTLTLVHIDSGLEVPLPFFRNVSQATWRP